MAWRASSEILSDGAVFSAVDDAREVGIERCRVMIRLEGEGGAARAVTLRRAEGGDAVRLEGAADGVALTLAIVPDGARCTVRGTVRGTVRSGGAGPVRVAQIRVEVGELRLPGGDVRVLANGYQSWTQARSFGRGEAPRTPNLGFARLMQDDLRNLSSGAAGDIRASLFAAFLAGPAGATRPGGAGDGAGSVLVVGQGPPWDQWLHIETRLPADGSAPSTAPTLSWSWELGGATLVPGRERALDDVLLVVGGHPNRTLDAWLDAVAVPAARREDAPPIGWCSWYYYFTKVSAADVAANLDAASARGVAWPLFQIDDGYQTAVGDWLSLNDKFPDGLRPLVDRIEAAGMRAGLWLAPFMASAHARLFREHPDWFLRDERGRPVSAGWNPMWGLLHWPPRSSALHALDTTHPDARAWLRDVIRTMVHDWGFRYLKLDFIYAASLYARAHDDSVTPAGRLRLGLQTVREAAGADVFLLGCGAPLSACVGLVDGMRVGPDIAPYWFPTLRYHLTRDPHAMSAKFAIRNMLVRAQLHRRLWENDPDCLLVRATETKLGATERRALADAIAITGAMFLVSDDLARLDAPAWAEIERVERAVKACAAGRTWPLDVMEREVPELVWNTAGWLAVFNFEDRSAEKRLRYEDHLFAVVPSDVTFEDVDSGETLRFESGVLDLGTLPAHGSRLLRLA